MKILVTGATGFVGSGLCPTLKAQGHSVIGLSRNAASARRRVPSLDVAYDWDALNQPPPPEALAGVDAVVHLAGESIRGRWTAAKKDAILRSRQQTGRNLVNGMRQAASPPRTLVTASAIGYYGDRGEEELTEDAGPGNDFLAQVGQVWEGEANQAEELGVRVVSLRFGLILGRNGGALAAMLPIFRYGLGGSLGSGRQWWAWIHYDDVLGLISHAIASEGLRGPVNATAPYPQRQKEFAAILGRVVGRPACSPAPAFAVRLGLGEMAQEVLFSRKTSSRKAQESGYAFKFPQLEPALRDLLAPAQ